MICSVSVVMYQYDVAGGGRGGVAVGGGAGDAAGGAGASIVCRPQNITMHYVCNYKI